MGTGSSPTAVAGTFGNTGGWQIGSGGGSLTNFAAGTQGYTGATPSFSSLTFGQGTGGYTPGYTGGYGPGHRPDFGGGNTFGFLDSLSFGEQYGISAGFQAIGKAIKEYNRADLEQQSYQWKAEIYKRQWELKQRQIEDRRITGKQEEDALRRKYRTLKNKSSPSAGKRNILAGGGSVMDILAGIDTTELADRGLLKTNVQKDIYGLKVGQWSDKMNETMTRRRASMTSPGRSAGMTMLTSAVQSGMKYWQYKNSMPGSL